LIHYGALFDHSSLSLLTYNTTYTQISMLIFMFMSIQRVRTFSSISYRESRMCAFMLTLIAFVYGIIVTYMQFYDGFCIKELKLNPKQNLQIDLLINNTKNIINEQCSTAFYNNSGKMNIVLSRRRVNLSLISNEKKNPWTYMS
jgi:hypothetical protein